MKQRQLVPPPLPQPEQFLRHPAPAFAGTVATGLQTLGNAFVPGLGTAVLKGLNIIGGLASDDFNAPAYNQALLAAQVADARAAGLDRRTIKLDIVAPMTPTLTQRQIPNRLMEAQ